MKIFRWKAIVPAIVLVALIVAAWTLYIDRAIRTTVEFVGTDVVGAKVDLGSATLHTAGGRLVLEGVAVTDPRSPMRNLVEVGEIVAHLNIRALLEKKAVVETLAVRNVRFGTPRRTSGAIDRRYQDQGALVRELYGFADRVPTPSLDLSGLAQLADWHGISADSLRTPREARAAIARGDSVTTALEASFRAADPTPVIDSARALAERLRTQNPRTLGIAGTARAVNDVRTTLAALQERQTRIASLKGEVEHGVAGVRAAVAQLDEARRADYAYARSLVHVPSLAPPDLSASIFQRLAAERMQPVLDWIARGEQWLPPGLRPRKSPGPSRLRMSGTTFTFPKAEHFPTMLVRYAETDLVIGGRSAAAGAYRALAHGITTEPAVYGRPLTFSVVRTAAAQGPDRIRIGGLIDRVGATPRDSIDATLTGVDLPAFDIGPLGAHLALNAGNLEMIVARRGEELLGRWHVTTDSVTWARLNAPSPATAAAAPRIGSREWADALVWRTVSGLRSVEIDARFSGRLSAPRIDVSSNVGTELSKSLQREVGAEVTRLEGRARAEVDRIVQAQMAQARATVDQIQSGVMAKVNEAQARIAQVKADLEAKLRELGQAVPLPRLPGIRRP